MQRRQSFATLSPLLFVAMRALVVATLLMLPSAAFAQNRAQEGPARALAKKAMEEDYLNTDFDKAIDKLNQAIGKCGTDKCGVPLRAQLKRDMATVQSAAGHKDLALAAMIDGFKIDAGLQLDPNYKTKELEAIYAEAKKGGAGAAVAGGPPPAGDFTHTPVPDQQVRTPVPIYVEYGGSETLKRVIAKYKGLGMTEWKSLELKSIGSGFGANVPCADVQTGDFTYYLQGFNDQNDPVASGGDRNNPYHVAIKNEAVADPPHLPGQTAPSQCADKGDCPPDFPGCKKGAAAADDSLKPEGEACEDDNECKSNKCQDTKCTAPPDNGPKRLKYWVGISASIDFTFLHSSTNVCQLALSGPTAGQPTNSVGYFCVDSGKDYPSRSSLAPGSPPTANAAALIPGDSDSVGGGIAPGDLRIMASFDYALTTNHMIGARVGYVALGYPGSEAKTFPPLHLEARYSYVFGDDPIGKAGFHPMIILGTGVASFDSSVNVAVFENLNPGSCPPPGSTATGVKSCAKTVQAWEIGGPFFLAAGGGVRWAFTPAFAAMLNVKLVAALGGGAGFLFIPTPELGLAYGF